MSSPLSDPAVTDTEADRVLTAVLACPGVAGVGSGPANPIATYLPGRQVPGIRLDSDRITVAVVARYPTPVPDAAAQVRDAVAGIARGRPVDVHVSDIAIPALENHAQPVTSATQPASVDRGSQRRPPARLAP